MQSYDLDELSTYGVCPMKWRYRYDLKLPYFEFDSQEAYFRVVRGALHKYVRTIGMSKSRDPLGVAQREFNRLMHQYSTEGAFTYAETCRMASEGSMAMIDFRRRVLGDQRFKPDHAGFDADVVVEGRRIHGKVDLLLSPPGEHNNARCVAYCHITREQSMWDSPRFMPVQYGWAAAVTYAAFDERAQIYHATFSPWSRNPLSLTPNIYTRSQFTGVVHGLVKGIEARSFWQAANKELCKRCCYRSICRAEHSRDLAPKVVKELKEEVAWIPKRASYVDPTILQTKSESGEEDF